MCDFIRQLINEDPPFSDIHQLSGMVTTYKRYIESYDELEVDFRKKIIESIRYKAENFIKVPFFDHKERERTSNPELEKASYDFRQWYQKRHNYVVQLTKTERVDPKEILKDEIPKRYPGLKFKRIKGQPFFISFVENLYEDMFYVFVSQKPIVH